LGDNGKYGENFGRQFIESDIFGENIRKIWGKFWWKPYGN
jgi:hypothetical protein